MRFLSIFTLFLILTSASYAVELSSNTTFYWQLTGNLKTDVPADLYDVDLFDTPKEIIEQLKARGKIVICYFSAGTYEDWRPDAANFTEDILGNPLEEWEGERWININSAKAREIMLSRLDLAVEKGCHGVEPDNVDAYLHNTGFNITYQDQIEYNKFLAQAAKERGLLIGLKNDLEQIHELVPYFNFALNEECHQYNECDKLTPFIEAGKPVFNAEYLPEFTTALGFAKLCERAKEEGIKTVVFNKELDGTFFKSCDYSYHPKIHLHYPKCSDNSQCLPGEFCLKNNCGDPIGTCTKKPEVCTQLHLPVCGCNGITYPNLCVAHSAGVNVLQESTCSNPKHIWLNIYQEDSQICLKWSSTFNTENYILYAAPFPELTSIYSIPLNQNSLCLTLWNSASFYIAVYSEGILSNIEQITLK